jgi:protein phosphatase methylesterase 1
MGHSMGAGPILSAAPILQKKGYIVPGVIVLDVVEGRAPTFSGAPLFDVS